jgi:hypothetical protein
VDMDVKEKKFRILFLKKKDVWTGKGSRQKHKMKNEEFENYGVWDVVSFLI